MNRLGIVSFYDADGVVDDSVEYYIRSLKIVLSKIIVVVNGNVCNTGEKRLKQIADEYVIRENTGFDSGAYKAILCNKDFAHIFKEYEEIILCNDTCFGPFKPFTFIFGEMEYKDIDFWGLDYVENKVADYLQSYFLVFKAKTYPKLIEYFSNYINEKEKDINNIYAQFEIGLFYYMKRQGYKFGYYCKSNVEVYQSPNYGLSEGGLPVIKKRCFEKNKYNHDNCIGALKYIYHYCDYDIGLILQTILRKYKITYDLEREFSDKLSEKKYLLWKAAIDYDVIKKFCLSNKGMYIYGIGIMARKLYWIYQVYMNKFWGFIVSDGEFNSEYLYDYPVFNLSEINDCDAYILVALNEKNTQEVKDSLSLYSNCLFLF